MPQDILELFSDYLSKHGIKAEPVDIITDFLEIPQGNEDSLNEMLNNSQRFIIIGKEIDKQELSYIYKMLEDMDLGKDITSDLHKIVQSPDAGSVNFDILMNRWL